MPNLSNIQVVVANHQQKFNKPGAKPKTASHGPKRPPNTNKTERIGPREAPTPESRRAEGLRRAAAANPQTSSRVADVWAARGARQGESPTGGLRKLTGAADLLNRTQHLIATPPAAPKPVQAPVPDIAQPRKSFDPDSVTQGFSQRKDYNIRRGLKGAQHLLQSTATQPIAPAMPTRPVMPKPIGPSWDLSRFETPGL